MIRSECRFSGPAYANCLRTQWFFAAVRVDNSDRLWVCREDDIIGV